MEYRSTSHCKFIPQSEKIIQNSCVHFLTCSHSCVIWTANIYKSCILYTRLSLWHCKFSLLCDQVVKEEYRRSGASRSLCRLVDFESDTITLDIPVEGITIKDWEISPLMPPVVSFCVAVSTTLHKLVHWTVAWSQVGNSLPGFHLRWPRNRWTTLKRARWLHVVSCWLKCQRKGRRFHQLNIELL